MAEESRSVTGSGRNGSKPHETPREVVDRLQAQVRSLRSGLEPFAQELDRRRHDVLHVKGHVPRRMVMVAGGAAALGVVAGLLYVMRRRRSSTGTAARLKDALRRIT